jgi:hypothetical protein
VFFELARISVGDCIGQELGIRGAAQEVNGLQPTVILFFRYDHDILRVLAITASELWPTQLK